MAISFIVTTYNVAPYLPQCLNSLAEVALDGDQIILVDDGSTDDSAEILSHFAAHPPEGVDIQRILLGTNTIGGVGIGANIGLAEATRDTVFFVDGDDWIDADGFRRARAQWGAETHDIMFTNYLEFDDTAGRSKPPADQDRWMSLRHSADPVTQRQQALNFIAVAHARDLAAALRHLPLQPLHPRGRTDPFRAVHADGLGRLCGGPRMFGGVFRGGGVHV